MFSPLFRLFSGFGLLFVRQMVMVVIKYNLFEWIAKYAFHMLDENYEKYKEITKACCPFLFGILSLESTSIIPYVQPRKIAGVLSSSIITSIVCAIVSSPFDVLFSHTVLSSATPSIFHMDLQGTRTSPCLISHPWSPPRLSLMPSPFHRADRRIGRKDPVVHHQQLSPLVRLVPCC